MADYDVSQVVAKAHSVAMTINLDKCQGNKDERKCIYVAWAWLQRMVQVVVLETVQWNSV